MPAGDVEVSEQQASSSSASSSSSSAALGQPEAKRQKVEVESAVEENNNNKVVSLSDEIRKNIMGAPLDANVVAAISAMDFEDDDGNTYIYKSCAAMSAERRARY